MLLFDSSHGCVMLLAMTMIEVRHRRLPLIAGDVLLF